MCELSKSERMSVWIVNHLPRVLVSDTERVGLSIAFMAVGLNAVDRINLPATYYDPGAVAVMVWSVTLFLGGLLTIVGMVRSARTTERVGLLLAMWGCGVFGFNALFSGETRGAIIIGITFICLAIIKAIRLIVSTAGQVAIRQSGSGIGE